MRKNVCLALSGLDSPAIVCKYASALWGIVTRVLTLPYATIVTWYVHISVWGMWLVQSILRQWCAPAMFQEFMLLWYFLSSHLILIHFSQTDFHPFWTRTPLSLLWFSYFLSIHNYAINSAVPIEWQFLEIRIFFTQYIDWLLHRLPDFKEYYLLGYNAVYSVEYQPMFRRNISHPFSG
jgi:hypothetical protein